VFCELNQSPGDEWTCPVFGDDPTDPSSLPVLAPSIEGELTSRTQFRRLGSTNCSGELGEQYHAWQGVRGKKSTDIEKSPGLLSSEIDCAGRDNESQRIQAADLPNYSHKMKNLPERIRTSNAHQR